MTKGSLYGSLYRSLRNGEANSQIYKIAKVLCAYLTHTEPSSTTNKCTTRNTETQYIRGHRLSVTHSPPIQKHSHKTRPTRLNSLLLLSKNNQLSKSRGLSRLGHWPILSNTQAPIRWRIRTWPKNEATSLTYKGLGSVYQQKEINTDGDIPLNDLTPPPLRAKKKCYDFTNIFFFHANTEQSPTRKSPLGEHTIHNEDN